VYALVPPDVVAVKVTGCPAVIDVGLHAKLVVKAVGVTVIVAVLNALALLPSVAVALTVYAPLTA
jgi:hypothetical protein